ncbi:MAG: TlpA family protein disulfide reductase [Maribacter sp.]|nr:TlpA family protein disulfide reductase [Maribacter sp.]
MRVTFFLLVVIVFSLNACNDKSKKSAGEITINKTTEKVAISAKGYVDLEGNPIELSDYKGKRILLNFWATWCRPCIEEMPALLKAQEILEKENYVFLLATDQSVKIINSFKARKGFEFKYIRYTGAFADLGINALPKTFLYNEAGDKVDEISGAIEWDAPEVIERLKNIK